MKKGEEFLKYALPDIMGEKCIGCHNKHPMSMKTDWEVGDLRGAVAVTLPVEALKETFFKQFTILQITLLIILTLMIISLLFITKNLVKEAKILQEGLDYFFEYLNRKKLKLNTSIYKVKMNLVKRWERILLGFCNSLSFSNL